MKKLSVRFTVALAIGILARGPSYAGPANESASPVSTPTPAPRRYMDEKTATRLGEKIASLKYQDCIIAGGVLAPRLDELGADLVLFQEANDPSQIIYCLTCVTIQKNDPAQPAFHVVAKSTEDRIEMYITTDPDFTKIRSIQTIIGQYHTVETGDLSQSKPVRRLDIVSTYTCHPK